MLENGMKYSKVKKSIFLKFFLTKIREKKRLLTFDKNKYQNFKKLIQKNVQLERFQLITLFDQMLLLFLHMSTDVLVNKY